LAHARFTENNQEQLWTLADTTFPAVLHIAQACMQHQTDEAGVAVKLALKIFLATTSVRVCGKDGASLHQSLTCRGQPPRSARACLAAAAAGDAEPAGA